MKCKRNDPEQVLGLVTLVKHIQILQAKFLSRQIRLQTKEKKYAFLMLTSIHCAFFSDAKIDTCVHMVYNR